MDPADFVERGGDRLEEAPASMKAVTGVSVDWPSMLHDRSHQFHFSSSSSRLLSNQVPFRFPSPPPHTHTHTHHHHQNHRLCL